MLPARPLPGRASAGRLNRFAESGGHEGEVPLHGGRTTPGIVRIGDAVHRPPTPNSDFVRRLLLHLQVAGFDAAPRPLGVDDLGRDVLSFLPGEVPAELSFHADPVLRDAAKLVRRLHDATAALVGNPAARRAGIEVVCHNDLSPCNFVFVDGLPRAIIDFDAASPGTRLHDLGYAAWLWLDLGLPDVDPDEQGRRLRLYLDAYGSGWSTPGALVRAVAARQAIVAAEGRRRGNADMATWAEGCRDWTLRHRAVLEAQP